MTTLRRYYDDSYTLQFSARVVERVSVTGKPALVLDQTCFYPTGGGQPHDIGSITTPEGEAQVIDVQTRADDKAVLHILNNPLDGETAEGAVNWARRFDLMQQHTGQHILSQAFIRQANTATVGFHLGTDYVTIDLDRADVAPDVVTAAETLANEVLFANKQVTTRLISPGDAEGIRMRRIPEALATDGLRIVEIGDFDMTACGGTHVRRTGEIGMIKVVNTEKYKGATRVSFVCGGRALRDSQMRTALLSSLAADLRCAISDLPSNIAKLRAGYADAEKVNKGLHERLSEFQSAALIANAEVRGAIRLVMHMAEQGDAAALRLLAAHITREPDMVALLATSGEKVHIICARSPDVSADMNLLLQAALAPLGGRGGGQPALAQGGAGAAAQSEIWRALQAAAALLT